MIQAQIKYKFTIKTGDSFGAGTDSNIFVELIGDKGVTPRLNLNKDVSLNKTDDLFEKDKTDIFEVLSNNVGKLVTLKIGVDDSTGKLSSAWELESVQIEYNLENER